MHKGHSELTHLIGTEWVQVLFHFACNSLQEFGCVNCEAIPLFMAFIQRYKMISAKEM